MLKKINSYGYIKFIYTLLVLCPGNPVQAARVGKDRPELAADLIDKNLMAGADAIVRYNRLVATIGYSSGVHQNEQSAITVLSEKGKDAGTVIIPYNKLEPLVSLSASVYDAHGKFIRLIHERDFQDNSYDDQESMFNDQRYKAYEPMVNEYPYTVVYEQESKITNSLYLPDWKPQRYQGLALELSSFELHVKKDISLHFHLQKVQEASLDAGADEEKIYTWKLAHLPAFKVEAYGPSKETYMPHVLLSADNFMVRGMAGSSLSWQSLGQWEYDNFLKDAATLPQATIDELHALTSSVKEPKEKAKIIYAYMQHKTHYVGVQIGIGGIKTETASKVDQKGYGDCKGLVNYTRALMKVCGIEAIYAEVHGGPVPEAVFEDFASLGFGNHIILCLPFKNDTCWLECTSQTMPFNYQGDFTDNRQALLITSTGGKLAHTHRYTDLLNQRNRNARFILNVKGDLSGIINTRFDGLDYQDRDDIKDLDNEKRIEKLKQIYAVNRLEIKRCALDYKKEASPSLTEKLEIEVPQFAELNERSMLVNANPFQHAERVSFSRQKRSMPILILRGYQYTDSVTYQLPDGYKAVPLQGRQLHSDFGDYSLSFISSARSVTCICVSSIRSGSWNASRYTDFISFHQQAMAMDELGFRIFAIN